jgi:predicted transcriptional regulator/DNA-binding CsgD family transcriptional regulator
MVTRLNLQKVSHKQWTEEQLNILRNFYSCPEFTIEQIAEKTGRSRHSVSKKARELNLKRPLSYRKEEDKFLKKNYRKMTYKQLASSLGRSVVTVQSHLKMLGVKQRNHKKWSEEDIEFLKREYKRMSIAETAKQLNRSLSSVTNMAWSMGLQDKQNGKWTEAEEQYLYKNYLVLPKKEIHKHLNRTPGAINRKAYFILPEKEIKKRRKLQKKKLS